MRRINANKKIRIAAIALDVAQWEIAQHMGITESALCRLLRTDLSPEKAGEIMAAICAISGRDAGEAIKGVIDND